MRNLTIQNIVTFFAAFLFFAFIGYAEGPAIVTRDPSDPSIHESPATGISAGVKQNVNSQIGKVSASYDWTNFFAAIGSAVQPFTAKPTWAGLKTSPSRFYQGLTEFASRYFAGEKKIGGKDITDVEQLGTVCGNNPGDPFWVGYPRIGNVEYPPAYQWAHNQYDCFCRCGEQIECPIGSKEVRHYNHGGTNRNLVACEVCFAGKILKHDKYVGTDHGSFPGYPTSLPNDPGYQECLRQSAESYSASGPGGTPSNPDIFGI